MHNQENRKRVVAYTRVSSKSEAQLHSFEYQNDYYKNLIESNPNYEFGGIYADHGISGRSASKRPQFMQMIKDCKERKIDVIYTKSVSRFSRNTEELLAICRELREYDVKVIFEKENIDTYDGSAKLMLTIAASVAEYDLKIISDNQRWATRKRFAKGYVSIGNKILGYKMDAKTNTLQIVNEEAEIVKLIYKLYLDGYGKQKIAIRLKELGVNPPTRAEYWNPGSLQYILSNEKYTGNSLQQKTVKENGYQKKNIGEAKQYYIENTHEPIISQEDFDKVQEIIEERSKVYEKHTPAKTYDFTGKIKCGVCGTGYIHKYNNTNKPYCNEVWACRRQNKLGKKLCDCTRIKDTVLKEKFIECYNEFIEKGYQGSVLDSLNNRMKELLTYEQELISLRVNHMIKINDYNNEVAQLRDEVDKLRQSIVKERAKNVTRADYVKIAEYDKEKVEKFVDRVTINKNIVTFKFNNGVSISRAYTNGKGGNKVGWLDIKVKEDK